MNLQELLDREAIKHLMAVYNTAGDSLRMEEFASVFADDGVLVTGAFELEGREAIMKGLFGQVSSNVSSAQRPTFVRHNLTTCKISFENESLARGRTYFQVVTDIGLDHAGVYTDEFRKQGDEWKIARRVVRTEYTAENSFFRPAEG